MPYEHTSLTQSQTATIQLLVSQVARAFFDPPYVVILERLMTTRDLWGEMELTHAVGLGQAKKELNKFMVGMMKQRLIKRSVADYLPLLPFLGISRVDTSYYMPCYITVM
jgi:hypothetical protein